MAKILLGLLLFAALVLLSGKLLFRWVVKLGDPVAPGISADYYHSADGSHIRYSPMGNWFELGNREIEGADVDSFEVLDNLAAKDRQRVYYKGDVVSEASSDSFRLLWAPYYRDDAHLFFGADVVAPLHPESSVRRVADSDVLLRLDDRLYCYDRLVRRGIQGELRLLSAPDTRILGSDHYSLDERAVYFDSNPLADVDVASFRLVPLEDSSNEFGTDGTTLFLRARPFPQVDLESFRSVERGLFKDNRRVYRLYYPEEDVQPVLEAVEGADPVSFVALDHGYQRDATHLYFDGIPLPDSAPDSYTWAGDGFARDSGQTYWRQYIISQGKPWTKGYWRLLRVDASHIEAVASQEVTSIEYSQWSRHNGRLFFDEELVAGARPDAFRPIGDNYGTDGTTVYRHARAIAGADPASFVSLTPHFSKDAKRVYFRHLPLRDVEPATFEAPPESDWPRRIENLGDGSVRVHWGPDGKAD